MLEMSSILNMYICYKLYGTLETFPMWLGLYEQTELTICVLYNVQSLAESFA